MRVHLNKYIIKMHINLLTIILTFMIIMTLGVAIVKEHIDSFKSYVKGTKPTSYIVNDMPNSL